MEKGAVQGEVRGTCPSCQKAVTTEMPRLSVEGTYYHQECHDVMTKALQTVGAMRFMYFPGLLCFLLAAAEDVVFS